MSIRRVSSTCRPRKHRPASKICIDCKVRRRCSCGRNRAFLLIKFNCEIFSFREKKFKALISSAAEFSVFKTFHSNHSHSGVCRRWLIFYALGCFLMFNLNRHTVSFRNGFLVSNMVFSSFFCNCGNRIEQILDWKLDLAPGPKSLDHSPMTFKKFKIPKVFKVDVFKQALVMRFIKKKF